MKYGYDIDSVLADFTKHFLKYLKLSKKRVTDWDDERIRNNFHKIVKDYKFWLTMPKISSPKDIKTEVTAYVTARPIPSEITEVWLRSHGFPKAPVFTVGIDNSKLKTLRDLNIDVFVDDKYETFLELNNNGIRCYLFNAPHNENSDSIIDGTDMRIYKLTELPLNSENEKNN